ncbi:hypothetical protein LTR62_000786 [Meristemomyces frigidus]|uniref:acylphosphatase n=1 Tax=Meristemomyces frigidus TaxID=1508187 RepID=A0AAN7YLY0_9PEZI|nr:hypothetical protein LTR62_000786 [Meristemomyces frigidus]
MSKRISYTVEGDVQGVNYRSFAVKQATGLRITGFAKNMVDGTVAGEAQGDGGPIEKFLQQYVSTPSASLKMGPSASNVRKVDHQEIERKQGDDGFER